MPEQRKPNFYKLFADTWEDIRSALPPQQVGKLLYWIFTYFFEGKEPDGKLPADAHRMFVGMKGAISSYRKNVLNGMKNSSNNQTETREETSQKPEETREETTRETNTEI